MTGGSDNKSSSVSIRVPTHCQKERSTPCPGESANRRRSRGRGFCKSGYKFSEVYECRAVPRTEGRGYMVDREKVTRQGTQSLITGTGPEYSGVQSITNLSWVQEYLPAGRKESKNHDEQLTHIVRVRWSQSFYNCVLLIT